MKKLFQLCVFVFLASMTSAAANVESPSVAEIRTVNVSPVGEQMKIEVILSAAVRANVLTTTNPSRLVLELPNTTAAAKQQHIRVNRSGVKRLRIGLTSTSPLLTRLVVDLDRTYPYRLTMMGNIVALMVLTGEEEGARPIDEVRKDAIGRIGTGIDLLNPIKTNPASALIVTSRPQGQRGFKIKYVADGVVYLVGGRTVGLAQGMKLIVKEVAAPPPSWLPAHDTSPIAAELRILSVAETSAVTEIVSSSRDIRPGDWAYLSVEDREAAAAKRRSSGPRKLARSAAASGFVRQNVPSEEKSSLLNLSRGRVRGRIGFDYSEISSRGATTGGSTQLGVVVRTDITGIAGTHWNLNGYWRGRMTRKSRTDEDALRNVLNKTYTMQLTYDNPDSKWVAGFGRLYLPWANSLDTIDGGYVGRRIAKGTIVGVFAGSTPDPASWHYNPERRIAGTFVNFEGGSSESFEYTSTAGVALNTIRWKLDRPFLFFENGLWWKRTVSVYHSFLVDAPQGVATNGITPGPGVNRSYLTVHFQPHKRLALDFYHNYFRDVPTAATALVSTGLVDKLLYEGVSFGVRVEPIRHFFVYTTLGQSDKTGDTRRTLNQMYGFTVDDILHSGLRADFRYSKFDSSFGRGDYKLLTLSHHIGDRVMWDTQFGMQNLESAFTGNKQSHFLDTSLDMNLTDKMFFQNGYTVVRGSAMNYSQWYLSLGYRFDTQAPRQ